MVDDVKGSKKEDKARGLKGMDYREGICFNYR